MRTDRYRPHQPPYLLHALLALSLILNVYLVLDRDSTPRDSSDFAQRLQQSAMMSTNPSAQALVPPADAAYSAPTLAPSSAAPQAAVPTAGVPTARLATGMRSLDAEVNHSLARTFSKAVGEDGGELAALFSRIFMWEMDLRRDVLRGDHVKVLYREGDDGKLEILSAEYDSNKLKKTISATLFTKAGDTYPSYWNAQGEEIPRRLRNSPMSEFQQVTALLGDGRGHNGMDFKAPVGSTVVSPKSGTVTRVNWNTGYNGNCIEVRFADGTLAKFLHLEDTLVRANQHVRAGERIATSGNTGRSTAPHLHYQLDRGSRTLDPVKYHGTNRRSLSQGEMGRFTSQSSRFEAMIQGTAVATN
ncbi:MAG: M23 family metallopeptidase [Myxococcota bacterium]|nr:M23 family metallopeptidase [Myxococcota bacterium]